MKLFKSKKAMSLVEVLVSVVLASFILVGLYSVYITGTRSWEKFAEDIVGKQTIRRVLLSMSRELRQAESVFIVKKDNEMRIDFFRPGIGMIAYIWSSEGDEAGVLIRKDAEGKRVLAIKITGLEFQNPSREIVDILVEGGDKRVFKLSQRVVLRPKSPMFLLGKEL